MVKKRRDSKVATPKIATSPAPPGVQLQKKSRLSKNKKKPNAFVMDKSITYAPIFDLLHNFAKAPDQWAARYILILTGIVLKSAVGLGPYLGLGQKPINGDFEAQRHWMEITIGLPISQWYWYDLQYWGLDYPPLTAFHLYICGKLGSVINNTWFALDSSRGLETSSLKTFMRISSLVSDMLIYMPALITFVSVMSRKLKIPRVEQIVILFIIMYQPSLILIDHGHFQYNSVMLGLFLFSLSELVVGNYVLASVWFVCSIAFKQMALYYAPFIFAFLLSKSFANVHDLKTWTLWQAFNFKRLFAIGSTVLITLQVILLPFINLSASKEENINQVTQILIRMFPFQRGLFEDKVANFWCTTNIVIKYRNIFELEQLTKLSLLLTLISILPPCGMIFYKNIRATNFLDKRETPAKYVALIYGFAATAWGFYLFSFQVHEKTVLVPLIPSTLLFLLGDKQTIVITQWINNIAVFSMWPLLKKDGLALQYILLVFLSNFLIGAFNTNVNALIPPHGVVWKLIVILSYIGILAIHFLDFSIEPPANLPDLWVILNSTLSFGCFSVYWLWILIRMAKL